MCGQLWEGLVPHLLVLICLQLKEAYFGMASAELPRPRQKGSLFSSENLVWRSRMGGGPSQVSGEAFRMKRCPFSALPSYLFWILLLEKIGPGHRGISCSGGFLPSRDCFSSVSVL